MKAPLIALLASGALLLTGCGGGSEQVEAASASPAAETSADATIAPAEHTAEPVAETEKVSLFDSCMAMFGEDGFALDAAEFMTGVESLDADTAAQADAFAKQYAEVEASAVATLANPVRQTRGIYEEFVKAWEERGRFVTDTETYEAANDEISAICGAALDESANTGETEPAAPELTGEERVEAAFLAEVRAAHPNLESIADEDLIATAENFCLIYGKEGGAPVVEQLITAAAGIKYSEEELRSINRVGVFAFCTEHGGKLG